MRYRQATLQNYVFVGFAALATLASLGALRRDPQVKWTDAIGGLAAAATIRALFLGLMTKLRTDRRVHAESAIRAYPWQVAVGIASSDLCFVTILVGDTGIEPVTSSV